MTARRRFAARLFAVLPRILPSILPLILLLGSCGLQPALAGAQATQDYTHTIARVGRVALVNHHPECNPFGEAFDPVWTNGWGWTMPRLGWHVMYPAVNYGIKRALLAVHTPAPIAATVAFVALPLIPHLRQAALGLQHGSVYQLNLYDWLYDWHDRDFANWTRHPLAWAALDVPLSCFARP